MDDKIIFTCAEWEFFKWHLKDDLIHYKNIDVGKLIDYAVNSAREFVNIEGRIDKMNAHKGVMFVGTEFNHFSELALNSSETIDNEKLIREAHELALLDVKNDWHEDWTSDETQDEEDFSSDNETSPEFALIEKIFADIKIDSDTALTFEELRALIDAQDDKNFLQEILNAAETGENFDLYKLELSKSEWKCFTQEISDMMIERKPINLAKAAHNARYFAEIERRIAEMHNKFA